MLFAEKHFIESTFFGHGGRPKGEGEGKMS
jgi:hypothetical protein